jgi:tetratricopeptide (TPR) repeat protein
VNVQLIDAETDAHLWTERLDRNADDLLALQNEITSRIAVALRLELVEREVARCTEQPDALDYVLRGRAQYSKTPTPASRGEAIRLFQYALALDPTSVEARGRLANELATRALDDMTETAAADIKRAETLAQEALVASPRSWIAHYAKGQVLRAQGRYSEAISEYEMVIAFDRNLVSALSPLGWCKFLTGAFDEAIGLFEQAIRLSPRDPLLGYWYVRIGFVHLVQSRTVEATVWLERARSSNPALPVVHALLASAFALRGEITHACGELAEARQLSRDGRYSSIADLKRVPYFFAVPEVWDLYETTFFAGLRKAGMPEE